jgi:hypothetical protein
MPKYNKINGHYLNNYKIPVKNKVNIYLASLMMKVPDHLYVLGDTYTCHT